MCVQNSLLIRINSIYLQEVLFFYVKTYKLYNLTTNYTQGAYIYENTAILSPSIQLLTTY